MGKSKDLSSDVKTIIIRNYEPGKSYSEIGRNFQLNRSTVYAVVKIYHEQGDIENRPRSGRKKKLDDRDTRKLSRLVKNNRSFPLQDITRKFNENREDVQYLVILKFPNWRTICSSLYQEPKYNYKYHYKNNSKLTFDF